MKRFFLTLVFTVIASTAFSAEGSVVNFTVDGVQRTALVFAPQTDAAGEKHPVVFGFHGHGGNMDNGPKGMRFQDLWPEAIVVYPQGLPTKTRVDPAGKRPGWQTDAGVDGDRDLKFFDAMLADLKKKYAVDDARVYASGFSNGAIFSYLLWAKRADRIAAFGICAGVLPASATPAQPRAVSIIAGQNDQTIPFSVQQQSIDAARKIDGATGDGVACGPICTRYAAASATPVETRIHPGGHVFPPPAGEKFVEFFKAHKL